MKAILYAVIAVFALIIGAAAGAVGGYQWFQRESRLKLNSADARARHIVDEALREAEAKKKEAILEAKEEVHKLRTDFEIGRASCRERV